MGKQIKKIRPKPVDKYIKICEQCGNGGRTKKTEFRCKYCSWQNGVGLDQNDVVITRGGLADY